MPRRLALVALLCVLPLLASCGCREPQAQAAALSADVDWARTDPVAFLDLLVAHPGTVYTVSTPPPEGWIDGDAVDALMARIESDRPAAVVLSPLSSFVPRERVSTEGREALFLIEGLREGSYPPRLCSVRYFEPDPDEYRTWWEQRRALGY